MKEIFWNSIADYNAATWPWQIVMMSIASVLTFILWFRPSEWAKTATKIYMVAVSLWIAFVYYMGFGSARDYSNVMTIFWCMIALSWIYDLATRFSTFQRSGKSGALGLVMLVLPLAYPFISVSRGLEFPQITTPMLPSAVALYMLGMLMTFNKKIPEDALLAAACIPSMVIFVMHVLKEYDRPHKPSYATVRMLVMAVALLLAGCMIAA